MGKKNNKIKKKEKKETLSQSLQPRTMLKMGVVAASSLSRGPTL